MVAGDATRAVDGHRSAMSLPRRRFVNRRSLFTDFALIWLSFRPRRRHDRDALRRETSNVPELEGQTYA